MRRPCLPEGAAAGQKLRRFMLCSLQGPAGPGAHGLMQKGRRMQNDPAPYTLLELYHTRDCYN